MKIGVLQASSVKNLNPLLYSCTKAAVEKHGHQVMNFGVYSGETQSYTYVEAALLIGLLLYSGAVDFVVTGGSSGQGMMLACNSLPGVLCGYLPTPQDAYLFGRINGGNADSLPLGLGFGWCGELNLMYTLEKLFDGPLGTGYPAGGAERKRRDARLLKELNRAVKPDMVRCLRECPREIRERLLGRENVWDYIEERAGESMAKKLKGGCAI